MIVELQSIQAFGLGEAYLLHPHLPSTHPHISTRLDSTRPLPIPNVATDSQLSFPIAKMRAVPQQPGPSGSRVIKKRSSVPRLGDRLLAVFTNDTGVYESTGHTESGVSATLTSSNLNRLTKTTHSNTDFVLVGTSSVCSDEDIVLLGTSNQSMNSESYSRLSSRSSTPRGDETPPTTLTGDDSDFSSDDETTLNLSLSYPINDGLFSSSKSTSSSTYGPREIDGSNSPIARTNYQSPITFTFSEKEGNTHGSRQIIHYSVDKPVESIEHKIAPDEENIPSAELLRSIVRSFLATETKVKNISPSITKPEEPLSPTPTTPNKVKPFWEPQRILEFYIKGAITPEKARETAKRYGYPQVIPVIDEAEALKRPDPSLLITKVASEGRFGFPQPMEAPAATTQRNQHNTKYNNFLLKLAAHSIQDSSIESAKPLHIFVDMSNIHIGFCNSWKISQNIPVDQRIHAPAFNFKALAAIMERNRATKKRVLASSVASPVVSRTQWPQHFIDAEQQGYKMNILNRVQKVSPIKAGRRRKGSPQGSGTAHLVNIVTSGDESGEDVAKMSYETKNGEQGVDEILHLNMMNSILDDMREPGSMVLATGDAAQAEFSDGFLEYATRALSSGWTLELVTWKRTISSSWMDPVFRNKFEDRFRIIYLDEFLEELNADLCPFVV
ncbi:hypothetical protein GQX73_g1580 [Xylaria multiplex]|uniref:NYN domain-containing protein n=1 Tax=Xylaria multiplex TaxID=323545 RepID=A0A7C8J1Y0_9PEZI|nr:hypothetical protein GQX73_g1580 [Xylaria multiplex]